VFITIAHWLFKQIKSLIRLKNEKAKTELMHLKSQVNPHFFFNMLNNLYGLVDKDAKKAQQLILKLSDMMRYSIYDGEKDRVLLSEEITYLENYIELHKMRYHKAIDIQFNIETNDTDYELMPLLFIILLENAFKHGVENLRKNAYVHINLKAHNNEVTFEIENNFDEIQDNPETGIGLKNLKRRLELVYPKNHTLTLSKTDTIYTATLNINGL
jgi:LytS/YehU family sensor histidine kinase